MLLMLFRATYEELVNSARLNWLQPVPTFADLTTNYPNAQEGDTAMAREVVNGVNKAYRYNGTEWVFIQQLSADAVNEVDNRLTAEFSQINDKTKFIPNSKGYLEIPVYNDANDYQTTHPSALYFENAWNGYILLAHTPYAYANDALENPIVASNDGINFVVPEGLTNPLTPIPEKP